MALSEEDLVLIVDYVDGKLPPEEMVAFEIRLTNEPELAESLESFASMDFLSRLVRQASAGRKGPFRFLKGRGGLTILAAAAAVLLLVVFGPRPDDLEARPMGFRLAVAATGLEPTDFNEALGLGTGERRLVPLSRGLDRGGPGENLISNEKYFVLVEERQNRWLAEALEEERDAAVAEYFAIPIHPEETCSALVLLVGPEGVVYGAGDEEFSSAYPAGEDTWSPASGRLDGGLDHVLPRLPVQLPPTGALESKDDQATSAEPDDKVGKQDEHRHHIYEAGFLVPLGVGRLQVLVGLRSAPLDAVLEQSLGDLMDELRRAHAEGGLEMRAAVSSLETWLESNGFVVSRREVIEQR